jgi:2,3-bisphosphoglycerate-independent phosphoglycerate mutase
VKYLILVPDGAADVCTDGEKTPLEEAKMPAINSLAKRGRVGLVRTIPRGVPPGSDAANLAVLGYDPKVDLTGRSPLEAVSMGIDLGDRDVAFRTNLVTLSDSGDSPCCLATDKTEGLSLLSEGQPPCLPYENLVIVDHASGDISDEEARILIEYIDKEIGSGDPANEGRIRFFAGVSYRNALIVRDGPETKNGLGDVFDDYPNYALVPPHDILGRQIGLYLPDKENEKYILALMKKSNELLKDHEVNRARIEKGLRPANSIWIWGEGKRPTIKPITDKYGIEGTVISAVDLIKGIGICAGLEPVYVEGATGTIDTNFLGKGEAAINAFVSGKDLAYIHVEAPDECAHQGSRADKIKALELIDEEVVAPIVAWLEKNREETGEEYRILIVPDHRTPVVIRTHTDEPVPYVLYDSAAALENSINEKNAFTERSAAAGEPIHSGRELADAFFSR